MCVANEDQLVDADQVDQVKPGEDQVETRQGAGPGWAHPLLGVHLVYTWSTLGVQSGLPRQLAITTVIITITLIVTIVVVVIITIIITFVKKKTRFKCIL